jgi:peptidoglycan biosynthesis protein MviN/MurJ (putative lipid II flippase)
MFDSIKNKIIQFKNSPTVVSVFFITGLYLASRVLGFVRSIFLYQYDKVYADLFLFATERISGTITAVFFMGALASSVLPVAGKILTTKGEQEFNRFIALILAILVGFMVVIMSLASVFTPQLLEFLNPKLWQIAVDLNLIGEYVLASRISLVVSINFGLQALFGVILNLKNKFVIFSLSGLITNLGCILGILYHKNDIVAVSLGLALGCSLSTGLYIWSAIENGFRFPSLTSFPSQLTRILREYKLELVATFQSFLPRMLIIDGFTVASLALGFIFQSEGQGTAFDLSTSIQNAFFVVVTALGIVLFPDLNKTLNDPKLDKTVFWDKLSKYLKNAIWIGVAISIGSIALSPVVIWLFEIFGKGQNQGKYIILLVQIGAFRLFFQAIKEILDKYLYTKQKKLEPMALSLLAMAGQIVFLFLTSKVFYKDLDAGVITVVSLVVYYMFWCILAILLVRSDYKKESFNIKN